MNNYFIRENFPLGSHETSCLSFPSPPTAARESNSEEEEGEEEEEEGKRKKEEGKKAYLTCRPHAKPRRAQSCVAVPQPDEQGPLLHIRGRRPREAKKIEQNASHPGSGPPPVAEEETGGCPVSPT